MKKINLIVGLCFLASSSFASDFDANLDASLKEASAQLESVKSYVSEHKQTIEAQWVLNNIMLNEVERMKSVSDASAPYIKIDGKDKGHYFTASASALVALSLATATPIVSIKKLRNIWSSAESRATYKTHSKDLKAYRQARKGLDKQVKNAQKLRAKGKLTGKESSAVALKNAQAQQKLAHSKYALDSYKKPKLRITRNILNKATRGTVLVAGAGAAVYATTAAVVIAVPSIGQNYIDNLNSEINRLETLLETAE